MGIEETLSAKGAKKREAEVDHCYAQDLGIAYAFLRVPSRPSRIKKHLIEL
jgi:hypothetical protein